MTLTARPSLDPLHSPSLQGRDCMEIRARRNPLMWLHEILMIIVVAPAISLLPRAFIVQVFWISSPSVHNTLVEDGHVTVSHIGALHPNVHRGDVVVLDNTLGWLGSSQVTSPLVLRRLGEFTGFIPGDSGQTPIRCVIGVSDDRVSCTSMNGKVSANGVGLDETYVPDGQVPRGERTFDVVVPRGHLWVMGDNHSSLADPRYHMESGQSPCVPVSSVVSTVQAAIRPMSH